jgi:hypothetical protein
MTLADEKYTAAGMGDNRSLALISDFNTLIAKSQKHQTPVFALTDAQLERGGQVLKKTKENRETFRGIFATFAQRVISLTGP